MEDTVKNPRVILDSRLSLEHHIKSLCSRLNWTLSYLNRVKNTHDQKSRILLMNALIFFHINYCSSVWGKCSENCSMKYKNVSTLLQKCMASNGKYLKRDHVTALLRDLKWINFYSILRPNEDSLFIKLYVSADSNMWICDLRNKVSQRITRNGSDVYIHVDYRKTAAHGTKAVSV